MKIKVLAPIALFAFVLTAVFGLYLPTMAHMGHEGCPFAPASTAVCVATLAHLEHWQSSFAAVLLKLLVLAAVVLILIARVDFIVQQEVQFVRYRLRVGVPKRPTLLQELFAQGILNRKEPQICF